MSVHYRACNLCEACCGLEITVQDNRVTTIRGDAADPISQGYLCPKGVALQDVLDDPDRLRRPVRRIGTGWEEISWDEAFDLVAQRLLEIRERNGGESIGFYLGNPITHGWAPIIYIPQLLAALGTRNRYSAASVDQQPQHLLSHLLFGSPLLLPVPDVDRAEFLMVVGGNPLVSNGSIMTAPNIKRRLVQLKERGGRLVVIDPRRTETAGFADEHVFIRPGTDAFFLAALAHVLVVEGLVRPGRAESFVDGLDCVIDLVRQVTPEAAQLRTGVPADTIRRLARELASARTGAVYARLGVCQTEFGTTAYWLVHVLNILTGRLDEVGGWMFAEPAFDLPRIGAVTTDLPGYDRWRSRVRGIPEVAAEFPSCTLADEILTPGTGQIRAMVLVAGNPVLTVPQGTRIDQALSSLEFCVAIDYYVNESTRHADVILPPTTMLEREEFDLVFPAVSVRNQVRWGERVIEPAADSRTDGDILRELLWRIQAGTVGKRRARLLDTVRRRLLPHRFVDLALRVGPWGLRNRRRLTLRKVRQHVHGLDLGPLYPVLPRRLMTQGQRIQLNHPVVVSDWTRVITALDASTLIEDGRDLLLIGRRHLRSNNSWMHNTERLTGGTNRCQVIVHPNDAISRGLFDGSHATIRSATGVLDVEIEIADSVMPGVICMPHGWGHAARDGVGWRHAVSLPGGSVNDITQDTRFDPLSGNAAVTALPVALTAARGPGRE